MRYFVKCVQLGLALLFCSTLAQAQPGGGLVIQPGAANQPMQLPTTSGINQDVPITLDPVCGIVLLVHSPTMPYSFYNNGRNPWGQPAIIPFTDAQGQGWMLIFGGSQGPCFSAADSRFTHGSAQELHFGFYIDEGLADFLGSPCWLIGANQTTVPCTGVTGYHPSDWAHLAVENGTKAAVALAHVAVAYSPNAIAINDLNRLDLTDLDWRSITLENNRLPAAEGDKSSSLTLEVPAELRKDGGYAVFAYDVVNPETSELYSTVTVEIPLSK